MQKNSKARQLTFLAMFAAIATVLMYLEFPLPFMPPFLKIDLSGIPILIAAFMFGPLQAIAITLVKDLIHLLSTQTGGVGELADFIVLSVFAVTAYFVYHKSKTKRGAMLACGIGSLAMAATGVLSNKFLIIPFYEKIMPIEAIVGACQTVNPAIDSINAYLLLGALPFNLIKALIISLITVLVYKKLSVVIKKYTTI